MVDRIFRKRQNIHKIYKKKYPLEIMINRKELAYVVLVTIITAFAIALAKNLALNLNLFLYSLLGVFILLLVNILVKKITAYSLESEVEIKLWEIKRFGFKTNDYFKKAFPIGAFLPLISKDILYVIKWICLDGFFSF